MEWELLAADDVAEDPDRPGVRIVEIHAIATCGDRIHAHRTFRAMTPAVLAEFRRHHGLAR